MADESLQRRGWRPNLDPRMVWRTRVLARLVEGRAGQLSTVIAGPGWGKSTALAQFADDARVPVAWCQLRGVDANIAAFAVRLCAVIAQTFPGFGVDLARDLAAIPTPAENWAVIARTVGAEVVETVADPWLLVLDDYHLLDADEPCNRFLAALLDFLPRSVHVVVASRRELPAPLARAAASATHLSEEHLRFVDDEGAAHVRQALHAPVPAAILTRLVRDLEGWPLGLTMLAEHMRGGREVTRLPPALPGLFDYLSEEIVRREPEDIQEVLVAAAVPERFSPLLLEHVLGRTVAATVERLARRHLFVTRLDGTGDWYRFHHLFRGFLLWRLERSVSTRERRRWERRVAEAWHALGNPHEAVRHEFLATDYDRAAHTLEDLAPALIASGQWLTLRSWLEELPAPIQEEFPGLLVYLATCHIIDRRMEDCRRQVSRALSASERKRDEAAAAAAIELLIQSHAGEDTYADHLRAVAVFERYRDAFTYDHAALAKGAAEAAGALAELNRFAEAGAVFTWALTHPAGLTEGWVSVGCFCGFYYHLPLGNIDTALAHLSTAYRSGREHDRRNFLPYYTAYLALARYHTGEYAEARRLADELIELASARGMERTFHAPMSALLGLVALLAGDVDEARARSLRFEEWRAKQSVWGEVWGDVLQAGLAGAAGDAQRCLDWTERAIAAAKAHGSAYRLAVVLIELARLQILHAPTGQSAPHLATDLLLQALAAAERIGARYCQARAHLLLATASLDETARTHAEEALSISRERGYDTLWLRHERRFAEPLLTRAAAWRLQPEYVTHVSGLLRPATGRQRLAALAIVSLGRFAVTAVGAEIDHQRWGRPKVMLLFKYLLCAPDHSAHRDVLLEALWPDLTPAAAGGNLNSTIYRLRRALEPDLDARRPSRFLATAGQHYRLILGREASWDVAIFFQRAARARQTGRDEDFAEAAEAYTGEYLPDNRYDDWTSAMREQVRGEYERLLGLWGEHLAKQGALARAIEVTERLLALDPTRESTHRTLMRYYSASGQRDRALRQYRRCETVLRRAVGVSPDAETIALYHSVLQS